MKRPFWIALISIALTLAACKIDDTPAAQPTTPGSLPVTGGTPGPEQGTILVTKEPTAAATFQEINRLAVGTLYLQSTAYPITKEQAAALLPFWQSLQADRQPGQPFDAAGMADSLAGIKAALTSEQLSAIDGMTQDESAATLEKYGVNANGRFFFGMGQRAGGPPAGGTPGAFVSGSPGAIGTVQALGTPFPTPDPDQMATFQAGRSSERLAGDPLFEAVITALEAIAKG